MGSHTEEDGESRGLRERLLKRGAIIWESVRDFTRAAAGVVFNSKVGAIGTTATVLTIIGCGSNTKPTTIAPTTGDEIPYNNLPQGAETLAAGLNGGGSEPPKPIIIPPDVYHSSQILQAGYREEVEGGGDVHTLTNSFLQNPDAATAGRLAGSDLGSLGTDTLTAVGNRAGNEFRKNPEERGFLDLQLAARDATRGQLDDADQSLARARRTNQRVRASTLRTLTEN